MTGATGREETDLADRSLQSGFLRSAQRTPAAPALRIGDRTWEYLELEDMARRWTSAILDTVSGRPERIGVFGSRTEVSYAGVLAALFAGAAFVPLSPSLPVERTRRMMASADLDALVVDPPALRHLPEVLDGTDGPPPLFLPGTPAFAAPQGVAVRTGPDLDRVRPHAELPTPSPRDDAYLLFTSGSTGAPKGVPISHGNVAHFLESAGRRYELSADDRLTQTFEQTFDLSVFDLFMAWDRGACVCVPQAIDLLSPFRYVRDHGITVWFSVPSVAALLLRARLLTPGSLPTLRWSLFCGEALPGEIAEAWQAAAPGSTIENLYGPTECTIACTAYRWDPQRSPQECVNGVVPIGRPFDGVTATIVDEQLVPVPVDAPGELCIAGPQTFAGYWRDPDATAASTFTRRDASGAALRFYRTGDRVRSLASGDLAFLGRRDHQVKVLGHRIELGEVEVVLRAAPNVTEAVAVPVGLTAGSAESLAAFVTGRGVDPSVVERWARDRLTAAVVPRMIRILDTLPRNANGKVDRAALEEMVKS